MDLSFDALSKDKKTFILRPTEFEELEQEYYVVRGDSTKPCSISGKPTNWYSLELDQYVYSPKALIAAVKEHRILKQLQFLS